MKNIQIIDIFRLRVCAIYNIFQRLFSWKELHFNDAIYTEVFFKIPKIRRHHALDSSTYCVQNSQKCNIKWVEIQLGGLLILLYTGEMCMCIPTLLR